MEIVHAAIESPPLRDHRIELEVERATLAKRRWRGVARDGREFGFDLDQPLHDGDVFFTTDSAHYIIMQKPEAVLEVHATGNPARIGWLLGNLHFPIEPANETIRVADDVAVQQMLERENIPFRTSQAVFKPLRGTGHHHHEH